MDGKSKLLRNSLSNKKGAVNQFRDMRSVGLHDLVLFIVTSDDLEQYSEKCIAGASIQSGVEESPVDTFNGDPKSKEDRKSVV